MDNHAYSQAELQGLLEALLNETMSDEEQHRLQVLLNEHEAARHDYLRYLDLHAGLLLAGRKQGDRSFLASAERTSRKISPPRLSRRTLLAVTSLAVLCALVAVTVWRPVDNQQIAIEETESSAAAQDIVLVQNAGAVFFRELTPSRGSVLQLNHEYSLLQGQIEVLFPRGARAIFDAPSVFKLNSAEQVLVSYGNCSVYAPDGSEGFEVLTPGTQFIDRGTRFLVKVNEAGISDVHVIEGQVDAISAVEQTPTSLFEGQARRYLQTDPGMSAAIRYSASTYRKQLPDRLVSYRGTENESNEIDRLEEVSVMRGGELYTYSFPELIGGDVTSFCELGSSTTTNFIFPRGFNGDRRELFLHSDSLLTGVLNPGGAKQPFLGKILTPKETDERTLWTPGMTVTFRSPVINAPGPDILFFEVHTAIHPLEGDKFHVRPLELKPGQHPTTVTSYDLAMLSPEAQSISAFELQGTRTRIACLEDLLVAEMYKGSAALNYRVVATGIDLSDMGVAEGDSVSAIFLQDALDDTFRIDPVMVVGLPGI